jgi:hypothetical protein
MARLIVEEGGKRRAFKVGTGHLTVGSGAEARLKLASTDVAEIHFELDVKGEDVVLRTRPGVLPPQVDGVPVDKELALPLGAAVELAGVRMWLEDEATAPGSGAPGAAKAAKSGAAAGGARARAAADDRARQQQQESGARHEVRRQAAMQAATKRGSRAVVQRTSPRVQKGIPGWATALIGIGGAAVVGLILVKLWGGSLEGGASPVWANIQAAEEHMANARYDAALDKLNELPPGKKIEPEDKKRIDALRAEIEDKQAERELSQVNMRGTQYMETKLQKYEQIYLQGNPEEPKIRVFLKRCRLFRERWPLHPQMGWVDRQESRFKGLVDLTMPATFADIEWEVRCLVANSPRDYESGFRVLNQFINNPDADDPGGARDLRDTMVAERSEYHIDRLQQARYEYEKGNNGKAVWWLVHGIIWIGDPDLATEAEDYLLNIPGLDQHLGGYQAKYGDKFDALMKHPRLRKVAEDAGLLSN